MTDREFSHLSDEELDRVLGDMAESALPPTDVAYDVNPWRRAMSRALWGMALTMVTLEFWYLDLILPPIGYLLMFLGFRGLRSSNGGLRLAYVCACVHLVMSLVGLFGQITVWGQAHQEALMVLAVSLLPLQVAQLLGLRHGIRNVQKEAGLPPRGGTGLIVWWVVAMTMAFLNLDGLPVIALLIAYVLVFWQLFKLNHQLDEAGYAITAAPVRWSDRACTGAYVGAIVLLFLVAYTWCDQYPMDWQVRQEEHTAAVEEVGDHLRALGFPEDVLGDLTAEEILSMATADAVVVDLRDYDMEQGGWAIGTAEEIADGYNFITEDEGERQLRTTYVGIRLDSGEREQWRILHHFRWLVEEPFYGTEAMKLVPAGRDFMGWTTEGDFYGRLLYDRQGTTYVAPYYTLGYETHENPVPFSGMFGQKSTYVFAGFSLPNRGESQRGYVWYDILETTPGYIVDGWCDYGHQNWPIVFPLRTAVEDLQGWSFDEAFHTVQNALQFRPQEVVAPEEKTE